MTKDNCVVLMHPQVSTDKCRCFSSTPCSHTLFLLPIHCLIHTTHLLTYRYPSLSLYIPLSALSGSLADPHHLPTHMLLSFFFPPLPLSTLSVCLTMCCQDHWLIHLFGIKSPLTYQYPSYLSHFLCLFVCLPFCCCGVYVVRFIGWFTRMVPNLYLGTRCLSSQLPCG